MIQTGADASSPQYKGNSTTSASFKPDFDLNDRNGHAITLGTTREGMSGTPSQSGGTTICPYCGVAELVRETRDLLYTHKGEATVIPAVTADFCPACGESITDMAETARVMREMRAFDERENAAHS